MTEILLSKLKPPRKEKGLIDRPRLLKLFPGNEHWKILLVTAPAGYGKTIFISQWAEYTQYRLIWYQLDSYDNDPAVFLHYLTTGLMRQFPALEKPFGQLLQLDNLESSLSLIVTVIVNYLQKLQRPILIVFDDYHVITEPFPSQFIQRLLEYLPVQVHLIISSRSMPPINFNRVKISEAIQIIKGENLRFTKEELQEFFAKRVIKLPPAGLEYLDQELLGWPAAVKLAVGAVSENVVPLKSGANLDEVYEYLATEILEQQPEMIRDFLVKTAVLEEITTVNCDLLLKRTDSKQLLAQLEKENLFLISLAGSEKSYRYHHLFRQFLLNQLGPDGKDLQRQAGDILLDQGQPALAMELYIAAEAKAEQKQVLYQTGLLSFRQGRWQTVARWLNSFTNSEITSDPWLSFFLARVEVYRGRLEVAVIHNQDALSGFTHSQCASGLVECRLLQAKILFRFGRNRESLELLEQMEQTLAPEELKQRFDIALERALILVTNGSFQEAERLLQSVLEITRRGNDNFLTAHLLEGLGNIYYFQGQYSKALQFYRRGMEASPERILPSYYMQDSIATIYQDWGELDKALEYAERSVALKEKYNLNEALPSAYIQLASIYVDKRDFKKAEALYQRAIDLSRENNGEQQYLKLNLVFLARCLALKGRWVEAKLKVAEALEVETQSELVNAVCQTVGAPVFIQTGNVKEGSRMLNESLIVLEKMAFVKSLYHGYADQAWYYLFVKEEALALEATRKSLRLAAKLNAIQYLITNFEMLHPVCKLAFEHDIEPSFLQHVLVRLGERSLKLLFTMAKHQDPAVSRRAIPLITEIGGESSLAFLRELAKDPEAEIQQTANGALQRYQFQTIIQPEIKLVTPVLELKTLGKLQITVQGETKGAISWRTSKTKDLLVYLIHLGEPVTKDFILEDLWPDCEPKKANGLFHTTLYYLRQTLTEIGLPDLIQYQNNRYQLAGDISADHWRFQELAAAGLRGGISPESARDLLEQAVTLYQGDYLWELDYQWPIPLRENLQSICIEALISLVNIHLKEQNYSRAIGYLAKLISLNPLNEEPHRLLMQAYAGIGNRGAVRKEYQVLKDLLRDELGLLPSPETEGLYHKLLQ